MAISGLHVGLIAWLGWLSAGAFGALLQRASTPLFGVRDARLGVGANLYRGLLSFACALAYSALAGFSYPTQRALIMVAVLLMLKCTRWSLRSRDAVLLALASVVLIDPLAVLSTGLWLSFAAVFALQVLVDAKPMPSRDRADEVNGRRVLSHKLRHGIAIQVVLVASMAPVVLYYFGVQSTSAPLVNLVAVPLVSMLVVPSLAAAGAIYGIEPTLAAGCAGVAGWLLGILLWLLELGARMPQLVAGAAVSLGTVIVRRLGLLPTGLSQPANGSLADLGCLGRGERCPLVAQLAAPKQRRFLARCARCRPGLGGCRANPVPNAHI